MTSLTSSTAQPTTRPGLRSGERLELRHGTRTLVLREAFGRLLLDIEDTPVPGSGSHLRQLTRHPQDLVKAAHGLPVRARTDTVAHRWTLTNAPEAEAMLRTMTASGFGLRALHYVEQQRLADILMTTLTPDQHRQLCRQFFGRELEYHVAQPSAQPEPERP